MTEPWSERDKRVTWHPFTQMQEWCAGTPLVITRGQGAYLFDDAGRRYLDAISSLWCTLHGHAEPAINEAITAQLAHVAHTTFLGLTHPPGIELAERLLAVAPPGLARVFYSDSGSTAVEIALKLSFQYWQLHGQRRSRFVHLTQAYHGDTLGAVGVGGIEIFHRIFGALLVPGVPVRPAYRGEPVDVALRALEELLADGSIAAVVVEPLIQGAAGMLLHAPGYLAGVAARCRAAGVHLIVDEVATGFGRTGKLFACEWEDVAPDFLCVAKGLSGGYLPLAATLTTEDVYASFLGARRDLKHFFHGHTFTANPLACAAGIASLALLRDGGLQRANQLAVAMAHVLASAIVKHPAVHEIRQLGTMVGIELADDIDGERAQAVCSVARNHGVILRPLGNVLVWMPPFCTSVADLERLAEVTALGLSSLAK